MNNVMANMTDTQKVAFAILCVLEVYDDSMFVEWAHKWLSGEDRTPDSAHEASQSIRAYAVSAPSACVAAVWLGAGVSSGNTAARAVRLVTDRKEIDLKPIAQKAMEY